MELLISEPAHVYSRTGATREEALHWLRESLENPLAEFRPGQWEAIDALVNRRQKLLVVERTGWGKSTVYFIATRLLRERGAGPTLIISPLLALMHNQVEAAARLGVRAISIDSSNTDDWTALQAEATSGQADVLLVSPERLANEQFVQAVLRPLARRLGLLVVDEAHCISDWGHDFRTDYRRIVNVLRQVPPNMPVLGTTATANERVIRDVSEQLGKVVLQRGTLTRESLHLHVLHLNDQASRLAWLSTYLPRIKGSGIVYVLTKRDADQVAEWLRQEGVDAYAYYSGIEAEGFQDSHSYRAWLEDGLYKNRFKALVATSALGMGYDKPDLGFVVHYQAPGSVIAYYQQIGRAGRAIDRAACVLMVGAEDADIHAFFRRSAFPAESTIHAILEALEKSDGLSVRDLEQVVNLRYGQITKALDYMVTDNPAPIFKDGSRWKRAPVQWHLNRDKIAWLTRQREEEWAEVQAYAWWEGCLMQYLAGKLDDPTEPCGKCAPCSGRKLPIEVPHEVAVRASRFVQQSEMPLICQRQAAAGAFTVDGFKGNLSAALRASEGRILSRWNDAGWGRIVAEGKANNHFGDNLVEAVAEMVEQRWSPDPRPRWLTCIPSTRHPELVPDFARRLAGRLGLRYVEALRKIRSNEPQKRQENRYHRCRNLDGVFGVEGPLPAGPVLLVDDMVDSTWTLTVAAALLLKAGSGPVFPLALADTGHVE